MASDKTLLIVRDKQSNLMRVIVCSLVPRFHLPVYDVWHWDEVLLPDGSRGYAQREMMGEDQPEMVLHAVHRPDGWAIDDAKAYRCDLLR